jgi:hypothetical protein
MPLIFRAMLIDGDYPMCGADAKCLGVRVPPNPEADIEPDTEGQVQPGQGGMSVAPQPADLPYHRMPRRHKGQFPRASGSNNLAVWHMGEGAFGAGGIADQLVLRPDPERPAVHGFVEPAMRMSCADYQAALAASRDVWHRWEGGS